jgi:hypothetical protein
VIQTRPAVSVAGAAVTLGAVPPGPCTVVVTNAGTATLYVGAVPAGGAGTVLTTSGTPVPASGVVTLPGYPGSSPVTLWGITSGGTVSAGVIISGPG